MVQKDGAATKGGRVTGLEDKARLSWYKIVVAQFCDDIVVWSLEECKLEVRIDSRKAKVMTAGTQLEPRRTCMRVSP